MLMFEFPKQFHAPNIIILIFFIFINKVLKWFGG